uniref:Putative ATPase domain containing protein n=1 Tax=viral metagenome TaxID=1070528 RepID=A0A6M3M4Y8_9ZZZZ
MIINSIEATGLKARDYQEQGLGRVAVLCGPTGSGKTAVLDLIEVGLTGQHASGDRRLVRPMDLVGAFARDHEIRIKLGLDQPSAEVRRTIGFLEDEEGKVKTQHELWTSLGPGGLKKQEERLLSFVGSNPVHFLAREFLRWTESAKRQFILDQMARASQITLDDARAQVGQLPDEVTSVATDPVLWLAEIKEGLRSRANGLEQARRRASTAARELAASQTAIGSVAVVTSKLEEQAALKQEADDLLIQITRSKTLAENRQAILRRLDVLDEQIAKTGRAQKEVKVLADLMAELDRQQSRLAREEEQARTIVTDAIADQREADQAVQSSREELADAKRKVAAAEKALKQLSAGLCPTCGQSADSAMIGRLKQDRDKAVRLVSDLAEEHGRVAFRLASAEEARKRAELNLIQAQQATIAIARSVEDGQRKLAEAQAADSTEAQAERDRLRAQLEEIAESPVGPIEDLQSANREQMARVTAELEAARKALAADEERKKMEINALDLGAQADAARDQLALVDKLMIDAVASMVGPLGEAMAPFLGQLGQFTVRLEDHRGQYAFRPGLLRDGIFRQLDQLSSGETTVVLPAFARGLAEFQPQGYRPMIFNSFEALDHRAREQVLRLLGQNVEQGLVCQAWITWNATTDQARAEIDRAKVSADGITFLDFWV